MFNKKKSICIVIFTILLSILLTGCTEKDNSEKVLSGTSKKLEVKKGNQAKSDSKETEYSTEEKGVLLRIAHPQPVDSPEDIAVNEFASTLKEELGDKIEVEIYPAMQIGSIPEMMESTQMGVIEMCIANTAILSTFCEDMQLIDLPYVLPKEPERIDQVLNHTEVGDEFKSRLDESGFKGLGFWFLGHRMMSTTNKEVHSPEDLKGLKIRIMESPILVDMYNSWGASAVPVPYSELYNSLQQGVVDGQENPVQSIYLNNLHEVQDYVISTYHATQTYVLVANHNWFEELDEDIKDALVIAEIAGREKLNDILPGYQKEYLDGIIASGTHYHELTDEEITSFKEKSDTIYDKHLKTSWQQEFFPKLVKAFDESR